MINKKKIFTTLLFLLLIDCKKNPEIPLTSFVETGKEIAQQAKAELGKNLMNAMQTKGTVGALEFCNTNAISLTNELAKKFHVNLKRVSDKPRNPQNTASLEEIKVIETFKAQILNKEKLVPISTETNTSQIGYYPIETNALCLQCHGVKEITQETSAKINQLYPNDQATGYSENQIRGMWIVEQQKK